MFRIRIYSPCKASTKSIVGDPLEIADSHNIHKPQFKRLHESLLVRVFSSRSEAMRGEFEVKAFGLRLQGELGLFT